MIAPCVEDHQQLVRLLVAADECAWDFRLSAHASA